MTVERTGLVGEHSRVSLVEGSSDATSTRSSSTTAAESLLRARRAREESRMQKSILCEAGSVGGCPLDWPHRKGG